MKRLLLALLILLLLLGGGAAAAWFFAGPQIKTQLAGTSLFGYVPFPKIAAAPKLPPAPPAFVPSIGTAPAPIPKDDVYRLPLFIGTVFSADGHPHFLQMRISLVMNDPNDLTYIEAYLPRVRDTLQNYTHDRINFDRTHPIDIDRMRQELVPLLNAVVAPAKLTDVLVDSLVVE